MKKVVLFGSIGLARNILENVILTRDVNLIGVCCEEMTGTWRTEEGVYEYCSRNGIPMLDEEAVVESRPDLGISCRYNRIIKKRVIDSFRLGIVNTHGGILPEYRGVYSNMNALINGEKEYGVTLHYIDEGVDTGDIIAIKRVPIEPEQTGLELYRIGERLCYEVLEENIDALLAGTAARTPQEVYIAEGHKAASYGMKDTLAKKYIPAEALKDGQCLNVIRAFDSDAHEPSYTVIGREKVYLRTRY